MINRFHTDSGSWLTSCQSEEQKRNTWCDAGTYWLVILRLSWRRGSRCRNGCWSCRGGLRHHGGLDRGERMVGSSLSRAGLMRPSSLGLCRSCRSLRLLPQSPTETLPELLHGNLQGPNEREELWSGWRSAASHSGRLHCDTVTDVNRCVSASLFSLHSRLN